jgi:putative Holliday junction resolvase
MTVLGIDYGKKRVGLAITDKLNMIASPLKTIENDDRMFRQISEVVAENEVDTVVVGLPLNMNGSLGPAGELIQEFVEELRGKLAEAAGEAEGPAVETIDERLTSVQAERSMLRADYSRAKRKQKVDAMAAQILLQSYLDSRGSRRLD